MTMLWLSGVLAMHVAFAETWVDLPPGAGYPAAELGLAALVAPVGDDTLLYGDLAIHLRADGSAEWDIRSFTLINTETGVRTWTAVNRSWNDIREQAPLWSVRVVNPDGSIHTLDPRAWAPVGSADADAHTHAERAPVPGLVVGSIVELDQRVVSLSLVPGVRAGSLSAPAAVRGPFPGSRFSVDAPLGTPLSARLRGGGTPLVESTVDGVRRFVLDLPANSVGTRSSAEPDLPLEEASAPTLEYSTGTSWRPVIRAVSAALDAAMVDPELPAFARERSGDLHGDEALWAVLDVAGAAEAVGLRLSNSPTLFTPVAEARLAPTITWMDRGAYAVAMLRSIGYNADLALLRTEGPDLDAELPGVEFFDAALVVVDGRFYAISDNNRLPARYPREYVGRHALIARADSTGLVVVPGGGPAVHEVHEEVWIPREGPQRAEQVGVDRGVFAARTSRDAWSSGIDDVVGRRSGSFPAVDVREDAVLVGGLDEARWSFREPAANFGHWEGGILSLRLPVKSWMPPSCSTRTTSTSRARSGSSCWVIVTGGGPVPPCRSWRGELR